MSVRVLPTQSVEQALDGEQYKDTLPLLPLVGAVKAEGVIVDAGQCALADDITNLVFSAAGETLLMQPV